MSNLRRPQRSWPFFLAGILVALAAGGCATMRVTDPQRTATEQMLMSEAIRQSVDRLAPDALRDRKVFIDSSYLTASHETSAENLFVIGELRSKLMLAGVRLVDTRNQAQIVLEIRTGGIGIDRIDYLLGVPAVYFSGVTGASAAAQVPISTPEISILKTIKQYGYASLSFIAYWKDTGEVVASSGPFVGRTLREDYFFFGTGPRTVGNIPTVSGPQSGG